jgi:hypothetical protein
MGALKDVLFQRHGVPNGVHGLLGKKPIVSMLLSMHLVTANCKN